jgi:hypothetical protein
MDCALIRRQDNPDDQTENTLFRQMLFECRRPAWCQEVVVAAEATDATRANLATIQELGYCYTIARPRPWQSAQGKTVTDLVTHLPRGQYTPMRLPTVNTPRRRTFGGFAKRVQLRHVGHVTVVLNTW